MKKILLIAYIMCNYYTFNSQTIYSDNGVSISYDINYIGKEYMEKCKVNLSHYEITINFHNGNGKPINFKGIYSVDFKGQSCEWYDGHYNIENRNYNSSFLSKSFLKNRNGFCDLGPNESKKMMITYYCNEGQSPSRPNYRVDGWEFVDDSKKEEPKEEEEPKKNQNQPPPQFSNWKKINSPNCDLGIEYCSKREVRYQLNYQLWFYYKVRNTSNKNISFVFYLTRKGKKEFSQSHILSPGGEDEFMHKMDGDYIDGVSVSDVMNTETKKTVCDKKEENKTNNEENENNFKSLLDELNKKCSQLNELKLKDPDHTQRINISNQYCNGKTYEPTNSNFNLIKNYINKIDESLTKFGVNTKKEEELEKLKQEKLAIIKGMQDEVQSAIDELSNPADKNMMQERLNNLKKQDSPESAYNSLLKDIDQINAASAEYKKNQTEFNNTFNSMSQNHQNRSAPQSYKSQMDAIENNPNYTSEEKKYYSDKLKQKIAESKSILVDDDRRISEGNKKADKIQNQKKEQGTAAAVGVTSMIGLLTLGITGSEVEEGNVYHGNHWHISTGYGLSNSSFPIPSSNLWTRQSNNGSGGSWANTSYRFSDDAYHANSTGFTGHFQVEHFFSKKLSLGFQAQGTAHIFDLLAIASIFDSTGKTTSTTNGNYRDENIENPIISEYILGLFGSAGSKKTRFLYEFNFGGKYGSIDNNRVQILDNGSSGYAIETNDNYGQVFMNYFQPKIGVQFGDISEEEMMLFSIKIGTNLVHNYNIKTANEIYSQVHFDKTIYTIKKPILIDFGFKMQNRLMFNFQFGSGYYGTKDLSFWRNSSFLINFSKTFDWHF